MASKKPLFARGAKSVWPSKTHPGFVVIDSAGGWKASFAHYDDAVRYCIHGRRAEERARINRTAVVLTALTILAALLLALTVVYA